MADVALIYPYVYRHARNAMLFYPLGISQLSAILREKGIETLVLDATFKDLDALPGEASRAAPRIIGIYVMMTMSENACSLARRTKEFLPDAVLVCGGPMPTLRPERFCEDFDIVFRGEANTSFPDFCRDYLLTDGALDRLLERPWRYPGIYRKKHGTDEIVESPAESMPTRDINRLPLPDISAYDHERYQRFWESRESFRPATIMTTYGCPFDCEFCSKPIFGRNFRRRDMDMVMAEISSIRSHGYDGLWIADDCFTLDLDHLESFCTRLIREHPGMSWTCLSRTDAISREYVELMHKAGCRKVFFGLESGDDEVLRLMNKRTSVAEAEKTVRLFDGSGIETAGFFMVGYPGETIDTIERTFEWALRLPLDEISFTTPFPLPDTRLFKRVSGLEQQGDWAYENENRFVYKSEFDESFLVSRINDTYEQFAAKNATGRLP